MAATLALVAALLFALAVTVQRKAALTLPTISLERADSEAGAPNPADTTAETV